MAYIDIDMPRCKVRPSAKPTHPSFEDLTQRDFEKWRVVGFYGQTTRYESLWVCECTCGTLALVLAKNLKRSGSRRCRHCAARESMQRRWEQKRAEGFRPKVRVRKGQGRSRRAPIVPCAPPTYGRFRDLTHGDFHDWRVLGFYGRCPSSHQWVWVCECVCGSVATVLQGNLKHGGSKRCRSCGNKRQAPRGPDGKFLAQDLPDPDPETIQRRCAEIRQQWQREKSRCDV